MQYKAKVTPVHFYPRPEYPTQLYVRLNPSILRALPKRWNGKPAVCMALAFTLSTGLYGCSRINMNNPAGSTSTNANVPSGTTSDETEKLANLSIPVFAHGTGMGSYGCVSVAPPVFLSEEEALQVIREEAAAKGVHFDEQKSVLGSDFPATSIYPNTDTSSPTWKGTLVLDGYDDSIGIGFEFVSMSDVVAWATDSDLWCSVESYDMKGTAERLAKVTVKTAVFYDPGQDYDAFEYKNQGANDPEDIFEQYTIDQKELMLEKLREQVRDFLTWLAAEGMI